MAQKPESVVWEKEDIPSTAYLFRYVHKSQVDKAIKKPYLRAMDGGFETSCDWDKYSTPEMTQALLALQPKHSGGFKNPDDYFIVKILVKEILDFIPSQKVEHAPIQNHSTLPNNRAHSHIVGDKDDEEVRTKLRDFCEWAIPPSDNFYQ
jgi:hypothetical protein